MNISRILNFFSLFLSLTFVGLGLFTIFAQGLAYIPLNYRIIFGCLLIAYGGFRAITITLKLRDSITNNNEE